MPQRDPAAEANPPVPEISLAPRQRQGDLTVATLCAAPAEVVERFVTTHLRMGAAEVLVYLDRPDDALRERIGSIPGATAICATAELWSARHPKHVEIRQEVAYADAYARARTAWIGLCDIDEYFVPPGDYPSFLDAVPAEAPTVLGIPCEAIWPDGAGYVHRFSATLARSPLRQREVEGPLRKVAPPLLQALGRKGLMGHVFGKRIVRCGLPGLRHGVHRPMDDRKTPLGHGKATLSLVHFDALSGPDWYAKHRGRIERPNMVRIHPLRQAQTDIVAMLGDWERARPMFEALYTASQRYRRMLRACGALHRITGMDG